MYRGLLIKPEAFLISTYSKPPCRSACTPHCLFHYSMPYTLPQITILMHSCSGINTHTHYAQTHTRTDPPQT